MQHYEPVEDEVPVNQITPPKPLHNDPMHHYERAEDEVPVNQSISPKPLNDDSLEHYERAEVEVPVIPPKPQAKRSPKKAAVTSTAHPVSSPTSTSNEAFISFPSNKSDHLYQFMKPLD